MHKMSAAYTPRAFFQDCAIGVIIALVSIPISMGYALVAGLPVAYGLYGSLLPIVCFGLLSSSKRFVFGVDAAPAALVGGMLASLGIAAETAEAVRIIPVIALITSAALFLFYLLKANRVLKFISQPVMGGFITGIGTTIICMQLPKLFGGNAGRGEIIELLLHLAHQAADSFHLLSFVIGCATIALILTSKHFFPKLPMQPLLMFISAALTYFCHLERYGIKTLPGVKSGLPPFSLPDISLIAHYGSDIIIPSISIAVVILSETLLATANIGRKYEDTLSTRQEILAYAVANAAAACSGSCPVNGSVSRTAIANQFGVQSQIMSLSAGGVMLCILLFGTGFIGYLPVPVLTGIVIAALLGTLEFALAAKFFRVDKMECYIFYGAFAAVLFFGTIYGVIVGVLLSSITFIYRQAKPSTDFLGVVPGLKGWYSLTRRGTAAVPITGVVIYQFSAPLFYANVDRLYDDILHRITRRNQAADKETSAIRVCIIEASGIASVDAIAASRLVTLYKKCAERGIKLYICGHAATVNTQLRAFGAEVLIYERVVRPKVAMALAAEGYTKPYPVESRALQNEGSISLEQAEFAWAFGDDAERMVKEFAHRWHAHDLALKKLNREEYARAEVEQELYIESLAETNVDLARQLAEALSAEEENDASRAQQAQNTAPQHR